MTRSTIVFLILASFWILPASAAPEQPAPESRAGVVHVVLVWLKDPGNAEHRRRIIDASQDLRKIPEVQDLRVGEVLPSEREVVTDDYDVGLYVRFANAADLQAYREHPIHTGKLAEVFVPIMERFQVFDFTITPPDVDE